VRNARLFRFAISFLAREKEVLIAFFATRLLLWVLGGLSLYWIKHGEYQIFRGTHLWDLLYRWDSLWYARIVAHGYYYTPDAQSSVDFFPLLPICIYALRAITGMGTALAGFLISNTALLTAVILLRRLVALDFPEPSRVAERTVWLLLLCPMTFFHSALYTEALFLMFSIGALLLARQGRWAAAGLMGALLTGTHGKGIFILVPLLWEALVEAKPEQKGNFRSRWWLLIVPSGLIAFATYLHFQFGDALAFLHGQRAFHRELATPWEGLEIASRYPIPYNYFFIGTAIVAIVVRAWFFFTNSHELSALRRCHPLALLVHHDLGIGAALFQYRVSVLHFGRGGDDPFRRTLSCDHCSEHRTDGDLPGAIRLRIFYDLRTIPRATLPPD
jgi:hypothetical protein